MGQEPKKESFIRQTEIISDDDLAVLNRIEELVMKDLPFLS